MLSLIIYRFLSGIHSIYHMWRFTKHFSSELRYLSIASFTTFALYLDESYLYLGHYKHEPLIVWPGSMLVPIFPAAVTRQSRCHVGNGPERICPNTDKLTDEVTQDHSKNLLLNLTNRQPTADLTLSVGEI